MPATLPKFGGAIPGRHLGRKPATPEMRRKALPLSPFLKRMGAKPPPDAVDYQARAAASLKTMLGNDQYGDCTVAAVGHQIGVMTAHEPGGKERIPTDREIIAQYGTICGPGDNGCFIPEVLDWWRDRGISVGGSTVKSDGYVSLTLGDQLLAKVAIYLFGGLHLGINLPREWYANAQPGFRWDVTNSDIVGGHSIAVAGYNREGLIISTWGSVGLMTWAAYQDRRWVEESYAVLSPDWYNDEGLDVHGVNVQALRDAIKTVKGGGTPDIPDEGPPVPDVPPTPPGPVPGPHEISHVFELFGYALRVYAGYSFGVNMMGARKVDYFGLVRHLWQFGQALEQRDWTAAFEAAVLVFADLGLNVPSFRLKTIIDGIVEREQARAKELHNGTSNGGEMPVDSAPNRR